MQGWVETLHIKVSLVVLASVSIVAFSSGSVYVWGGGAYIVT